MKKAMLLIIFLTSVLTLAVWIGMEAYRTRYPVIKIVPQKVPILLKDTQRLLLVLGFEDTIKGKLTADGKWGRITEQALNDYYASKYFPKQEIPETLEKF